MKSFRFTTLEKAIDRQPIIADYPSDRISDFYGCMVFNESVMQEYLTPETFTSLQQAIGKGSKIDRQTANQIASAMKTWAINHGATHYTHWFHPLTDSTAEKHEAFINSSQTGKVIEEFKGVSLIQQESDASSFPNGGIRNTFEARGYTAWDPTSPVFILENTLCIPTIFFSYTGESLDYKTPLLKSIDLIDFAATKLCQLFDKSITKVYPTLGLEQEYFLVDSALFSARPDLVLAGRTIFGHTSAKGQQLHDHYFGTIHARVRSFMRDFETEAFKLGIPLKIRHNEVAPSQFECAPIYEEANVAIDHNQLLMHLLERVSRKHSFKVLLHEKPYEGVNGSGKHCNWSLSTNTGINLLTPGKTTTENLRFITILTCVLKSVFEYQDVVRASIASAGNDLRLGANEAPPAIISAFIGQQLSSTLDEIEKMPDKKFMSNGNSKGTPLKFPKIPEVLLDNTDRNRTSPFAFTGNKFEFRAAGSSANAAKPITLLNTIIAEQFLQFTNEVRNRINSGLKKEDAVFETIKKYIKESKPLRFEGNSYCDEWRAEAEKRGLSNEANTPDAIKAYTKESIVNVFDKHKIMNYREIAARNEITLEKYVLKLQIEARLFGDLSINHIIPTAIKYQNTIIENVKGLKEILDTNTYNELSKGQIQNIKEISEHISRIRLYVEEMTEERKIANRMESIDKKSHAYCYNVKPYFEKIRYHVDKLELMVDDSLWPLPKYRELLFIQ